MGKAFEKQTKTIEDQGKKHVDALEALKQKELKAMKENENVDKKFIRRQRNFK